MVRSHQTAVLPQPQRKSPSNLRPPTGESMRIAFLVTRGDELGGAQVHVRDLSIALRTRGHSVAVLCGSDRALGKTLPPHGIEVYNLPHLVRPIRPLADLRGLAEIRRALRRISPDILSTHSSKAGILGRLAGRSLGLTTMFTAHGWAFADGQPRLSRLLYGQIERWAAPLADQIVTVSEHDRIAAMGARIGRPEQVITIHNAMPDIDPALRAKPQSSPPTLISVARFGRQKDHATLLSALARILDLDWRLWLVGDGPTRPAMESLADRLRIAPRLTFLGERRDVPRLLSESHAFLLISNWEGFPRSILEAMRAGLPTIASDVGGVSEAVADGMTGFLTPRKDIDHLERRLRRLISEPALRDRLGRAARLRYEERFTFEPFVGRTLAAYQRAIAANRERARPF